MRPLLIVNQVAVVRSGFRGLDWTLGRRNRKTEMGAETGNCLLGKGAGAAFDKASEALRWPGRELFKHPVVLLFLQECG